MRYRQAVQSDRGGLYKTTTLSRLSGTHVHVDVREQGERMNKPTVYYAYVYSFFEERNVEIEYFWNEKKAKRWLKELVEYHEYDDEEYEWGVSELDIQ